MRAKTVPFFTGNHLTIKPPPPLLKLETAREWWNRLVGRKFVSEEAQRRTLDEKLVNLISRATPACRFLHRCCCCSGELISTCDRSIADELRTTAVLSFTVKRREFSLNEKKKRNGGCANFAQTRPVSIQKNFSQQASSNQRLYNGMALKGISTPFSFVFFFLSSFSHVE